MPGSEKSTKVKLWTAEYTSVFIARFVINITFYMLATTLAIIVYQIYDATPAEAGSILGVYAFGLIAGRMLITRYTDVIGRRKLMLISCGIMVVVVASYYAPVPLWLFGVFRFLHGALMGSLTNTLTTVGISVTPRERFNEGVSVLALAVTLSTAVGPFIGSFFLRYFDYTYIFAFVVGITVAVFIILMFVPVKEIELTEEQRKSLTGGFHLNQIFEKKAFPMAIIVGFLSNCCYIIISNFLNSFAQEQGFFEYAWLFFLVYAGFVLVFRPAAGKLMDRKGDNIVMCPAIVVFGIALVLLSQCASVWMMFVIAFLVALGQSTLFSGGQAISARDVDEHRLSIANSTYYSFADLGYALGPIMFGAIVPVVGYSGMYLCGSAVMVVCFALYYAFHGRHVGNSAQNKA